MDTVFTSRVRDLSAKGLGVVDHPDGRVFFVPGAWPGDEGEFEVQEVNKRYGFARFKEITRASDSRIEPACKIQGFIEGRCGGCSWMMARYDAQLREKQKIVENQFKRNQIETSVLPILGSENQLGYRNRAQFKTDGKKLGFVSSGTHHIVDVEDCLVLTQKNRETLKRLRRRLPDPSLAPADGRPWQFLEVNEEVGMSETSQRLPFRQGNTAQNKVMKKWLAGQLEPGQCTLELFCGSGNFTQIIAQAGGETLAVEVSARAIDELTRSHLTNVDTLVADLSRKEGMQKIRKRLKEKKMRPTRLVLDPPREGFKKLGRLVDALSHLETILYVSCDLMSLTRDLKILVSKGWRCEEVQPLDLFPQTPHVETMVKLRKL